MAILNYIKYFRINFNSKLLGLITIATFIGPNYVFAQDQEITTYERKIKEITAKYFSICINGYNKPLSVYEKAELEIYTNEEDARDFILGLAVLNYAIDHTEEEVKSLIIQIEKDFKGAEKLKTATDLQREKEAKQRREKLEREKELKEYREAYLKTDKGKIYSKIKNSFGKWNQKGEFEKESSYSERLRDESKEAFNEICIKQIRATTKEYYSAYNKTYVTGKRLSDYDSEDESFDIYFDFNGIEWQKKMAIPIAHAESFKNNWEHLKAHIDDYDWSFVGNSLCPTLVTLVDKRNNLEYAVPLSIENSDEITIRFNDLEIKNEFLRGYVFKFSEAKVIEERILREKKREKEFEKNGELFRDKKEFDNFFDKGDNLFQKEVNERILKKEEEREISKFTSSYSSIPDFEFRDAKQKYSRYSTKYRTIDWIYKFENKPYYSSIIETVIEINKELNKEWSKNGEYFASNIEFFEAFISGKYKERLRQAKKIKRKKRRMND